MDDVGRSLFIALNILMPYASFVAQISKKINKIIGT